MTAKLDEFLGVIYRQDRTRIDALATASLINGRDEDGRTPLMHAVLAEDANPEIVKLLVTKGADVNAVDKQQKWTALHFAARDQKEAVVRALIDAGANVAAVDVFGNTPLWRAVLNPRAIPGVIKLLLDAGSDPNAKNNHDVSPLDNAKNMGKGDLIELLEGRS